MAQQRVSSSSNKQQGLNHMVRKSTNDLFEMGQDTRFKSMYAQAFKDYSKKQNSGGNGSNSAAMMSPMAKQNLHPVTSKITTPVRTSMNTIDNRKSAAGMSPDPKMRASTQMHPSTAIKSTKKSDSKSIFYQQQSQSRKFGEYNGQGVDHNSVERIEPSRTIDPQNLFQTYASGFSGTIGASGVSPGRRNRCSDRFVRYPYPGCAVSYYQKEFPNKTGQARFLTEEDTFNLEKESKIINPHPMEMGTTHKSTFTPFKVLPPKRELKVVPKNDAPAAKMSHYQAEYPNWQNGKQDIYHERHPQYPYYSLPFKGDSTYKRNFTEEQMKQLKRHQHMIETLGQPGAGSTVSQLRVTHYQPQKFEYETTNQKTYQAFKLSGRPQTSKPNVDPVVTKTFHGHFNTFHKKEYVKHQHRIPEIDLIPYP